MARPVTDTDARANPCPYCGAQPDQPCVVVRRQSVASRRKAIEHMKKLAAHTHRQRKQATP